MLVDGTEGVKYFVPDENLPVLVVDILVAKLIDPDGDTEKLLDAVGRVCLIDGSNLVDIDASGVDELPGMDIERAFVGTEPDDVLYEVKLTVKAEFVGVGFVSTIFESVIV